MLDRGQRPQRRLWERIALAHIRVAAQQWWRAEDAGEQYEAEERMDALASLLRHVRGAYAMRAVAKARWVSEALGMFEEDV